MNAIFRSIEENACVNGGVCASEGMSRPRSHGECASLGKLQWFVGLSYPMMERLAVKDLARKGFTAWLPLVNERRAVLPRALLSRKMRRESPTTAIVETPMFPRYFFIQLNLAVDDWSVVLDADGVKDLLRNSARKPMAVRGAEIDAARQLSDEMFIPAKLIPDIEPGSKLFLENGPFADHEGVCLWSSDTRVRVLLNLFGRDREVTMSRKHVMAI